MSDLGLQPEQDDEFSILDPIREQGVVGGLGEIAAGLLPGSAGFQEGTGGGIGDLFRGFLAGAKQVPGYLPGIGDAMGIRDALTQNTDLFTKGVSFAGVIALPFAGVKGVQSARARLYGSRTPLVRPDFPVTVGYTQPDIVSRLSSTPDIDTVMPSARESTRRVLLAGRHAAEPEHGYRTLSAAIRGSDTVDESIDAVGGFFQGLGHTLVDMIPDYRASITEFGGDIEAAALGASVQEAAKWGFAADNGLIEGADEALVAWDRLKAGGEFGDADAMALAEGMVGFADVTQSLGHPELILDDPRFTVSRIDVKNKRLGLTTPAWDDIPFWQLDMTEANRRLNHMMALNPAQMLPHMVQNILDLWDGPVQQNWDNLQHSVSRYDPAEPWGPARDWFRLAREDAEVLAEGQDFSTRELVGAASVMSAGELWETNIDKALEALRYVKSHPRATPKTLHRYLLSKSFNATEDDAIRVMDMMRQGPEQFFHRDAASVQTLKQAMFDRSIDRSTLDQMIATGEAQYLLMSGELPDIEGAMFANARDLMPVVIDRHGFSMAMGFSIEPASNSLTGNANADVIGQAYRTAASIIGEVEGRVLTPSELFAIEWVMWRELKGVTRGYIPVSAPKRWIQDRGLVRPPRPENANRFGLPPNWSGYGPGFVFRNRILDFLHKPLPMELGAQGVARTTRFEGQPVETLSGRFRSTNPKTKKAWQPSGNARDAHGVDFVSEPGGYRVEAPEDIDPLQVRTTYPSTAWGQKGPIRRPRMPAYVDNVDDEMGRIMRDTTDANGQPGVTGGRMMTPLHRVPAFEDGRHMVISIGVEHADLAHPEFIRLLNERGVKFESTVEMPHEGPTLAWEHKGELYWSADELIEAGGDPALSPKVPDVEKRVNLVLDFDSPQDLRLAYATYREPVPIAENAWEAAQGANAYWSRYGQALGMSPPQMVRAGLEADPVRGRAMAEAYEAMPDLDESPEVIRSYEALRQETATQFDHMTNELGIRVEVVDYNPYDTPEQMIADVRDNRRLKVLRTGATEGDEGHAFFSNDENDMFRAVHDFYGHAAMGNPFDRHGEEAAWARHAQMFSDSARPAMTTETRGQNSWLNFSPANEARRARGLEAEFGPQKLGLLPKEFWEIPPDYFDPKAYRGKAIYPDQIVDLAIYAGGETDVPPGLVQVFEHHYVDPSGRRLVSMANEGSPDLPHAVPAFIEPQPDGLHAYFGRNVSKRHANQGRHRFEGQATGEQGSLLEPQTTASLSWDGAISVVNYDDITGWERARHILDVDVGTRGIPADRAVELFVPEFGQPVMSFKGPAGGTPARTAKLYLTGRNELTVELPSPDGTNVQGNFHDDVRHLLARTGWRGKTRVVARGGWEPPAPTTPNRAPRAPQPAPPAQEGLFG